MNLRLTPCKSLSIDHVRDMTCKQGDSLGYRLGVPGVEGHRSRALALRVEDGVGCHTGRRRCGPGP